jgi:hypothetical protein
MLGRHWLRCVPNGPFLTMYGTHRSLHSIDESVHVMLFDGCVLCLLVVFFFFPLAASTSGRVVESTTPRPQRRPSNRSEASDSPHFSLPVPWVRFMNPLSSNLFRPRPLFPSPARPECGEEEFSWGWRALSLPRCLHVMYRGPPSCQPWTSASDLAREPSVKC